MNDTIIELFLRALDVLGVTLSPVYMDPKDYSLRRDLRFRASDGSMVALETKLRLEHTSADEMVAHFGEVFGKVFTELLHHPRLGRCP